MIDFRSCRKGDFNLSFGMIFSIILIIAVIAVAFYVIGQFLGLKNCTEISLFLDDFDKSVDRVWKSEIARTTFSASLPSGIESVCFGNLSLPGSGIEYETLKKYSRSNSNLFLYPPEKACEIKYTTIEHLSLESLQGFTCFDKVSGKVSIVLEKNTGEALVRVKNE